jgi:hypothetical protein
MELGVGILIVAIAVSLTLGRMFLKRNEWVDEKPKAKQHQKIQQFEPEHATPSIEDLIEEEAADLGLNDIPGGDGVETSVKLRVWHRDSAVRSGCADGTLRYEVDAGVEPADAELGQVHLRCLASGEAAAESAQSTFAEADNPREAMDSSESVHE